MSIHSPLFEEQVIQIASLGVWHIVTGKPMKQPLHPAADHRWQDKTGLFVTLRREGQTRGSMGILESTTTLQETLFDTAAQAATHDSRYPPIQDKELPELEIEVNLLSEIVKMKTPADLVIGNSGLIISRGEKRAVLLPHVAVEQKWNAEQFLEACCEKAQLSHRAWQDPNTLVECFSTLIIKGGSLLSNISEFVNL